ncbi:hypothetical protein LguiB_031868 [Lonicera macranthoides]
MGDFNVIHFAHELLGGIHPDIAEMADFNNCLNAIEVVEMTTRGGLFTWDNKRNGEANIKSKIDKVFCNESWLQEFPNVEAAIMVGGVLDHAPIIVTIAYSNRKGNKPFRFFDFWMRNMNFADIVRQSWCLPSDGFPMFQVTTKLRRLKFELKKLNKRCYSNISVHTREAREDLHSYQRSLQNSVVTSDMRNKERDLLLKYVKLRDAEEEFFRQKSRINWLNCGDRNTAYFHRKVKVNKAQCKVMSILGEDGQRIEGEMGVHCEAVRYFSSLLGQSGTVNVVSNVPVQRKLRSDQRPGGFQLDSLAFASGLYGPYAPHRITHSNG